MKITHITEHYMYPMIKLMMDTSKFKNDLGISANSSVLYALNLAHVNLHIEDMDLFDYFVMNQISPIRELTHRIDKDIEIIDICNPSYFIALGNIAEKSLKQISPTNYCKIMHPSAIMQSKQFDYSFDDAVVKIKHYLQWMSQGKD